MMFAAAVGHRSGRASPSLRDAPQQQSMEMVGTETIYRNRNAVQTNPATSLNQDVEHHAILIHGAPQIVLRTLDPDEHLVQVPLISRP
jgi:hypothetical protein